MRNASAKIAVVAWTGSGVVGDGRMRGWDGLLCVGVWALFADRVIIGLDCSFVDC